MIIIVRLGRGDELFFARRYCCVMRARVCACVMCGQRCELGYETGAARSRAHTTVRYGRQCEIITRTGRRVGVDNLFELFLRPGRPNVQLRGFCSCAGMCIFIVGAFFIPLSLLGFAAALRFTSIHI